MTDASVCASIARRHARTFALAASLLPREKRRPAFAMYAFCRLADDIVDGDSESGGQRPEARAAGFNAYRAALAQALAGAPADEVFREVAWAVARFGIPVASLHELLDGLARDLHPSHYTSWAELESYCAGVASSVGEMCTHIFGTESEHDLERAVRHARQLGVAMQLTNVLRDVGEDALLGRCYLPTDELAAHGFTIDDVLSGRVLSSKERWSAFMRMQIARARDMYARSFDGIPLLARDAQQCASVCARGYGAILNAIESQSYDTINARAVVPGWQKVTLLWQAWWAA